MAWNEIQPELLKILLLDKTHQNSIIKRLDSLFRDFGVRTIQKWRYRNNNNNTLLHELVEKDMPEVIRHIVGKYEFDINIRRDSDGLTPFQLALQNDNSDMCDFLKELGASHIETEDVSQWLLDEDKGKAMNIVWLDLEMTSIEEPEIMECAVIITDKEFNELGVGSWVIHFEQDALDKLGDWHQKTFTDHKNGGNDLFADVLKSKLTREQVETELLALIARHCPKGKCPLAGSSIHTDKDVLKRCMPKVNDYLHYRIIDVSSFQAVMRRWAPWMEANIKRRLAADSQEIVNHRAMDDIKWSMAFMKQFRRLLPKQPEPNRNHRSSSHHHDQEASNQQYRGGSNHQNRGGSNHLNRGGSNHLNRGGSNHQNRGASNHQNRGASNNHSYGASNHDYKRSVSESQASDESDLPMISPSVDLSQLYGDEKRLVERILFEKKFDAKSLKLSEKSQRIYDANPHLREVFINKELIEIYDKDFTKENRVLTMRVPRSGNNPITFNLKKHSTTEHWGQRKLLLTEIEFLTKYGSDDDYLVVYAGAAPGSHVTYLSSLFPQLEFVLIDDKEFTLKLTDKIKIRSEKFTHDMAQRYSSSNRKILFICNVRTYRAQGDGQNDGTEDMINQMDWYKLMKPHVSLLNFRLPLESGNTLYLKGHQIIEPWSSRRTTECRLLVKKDAKEINYDHKDFDSNLLYFQYVTRVMYYEHDMDDVDNEGLDHCYDCRAEIYILQEYLSKVQRIKSGSQLKSGTARMTSDISKQIVDKTRPRFIDVPRTLDIIPKKSTNVSTNV